MSGWCLRVSGCDSGSVGLRRPADRTARLRRTAGKAEATPMRALAWLCELAGQEAAIIEALTIH